MSRRALGACAAMLSKGAPTSMPLWAADRPTAFPRDVGSAGYDGPSGAFPIRTKADLWQLRRGSPALGVLRMSGTAGSKPQSLSYEGFARARRPWTNEASARRNFAGPPFWETSSRPVFFRLKAPQLPFTGFPPKRFRPLLSGMASQNSQWLRLRHLCQSQKGGTMLRQPSVIPVTGAAP